MLKQLGYKNVDVMGYSFGGGVAFRLAAQHPQMVRRLALVSAGFAADAFYPEMREQQKHGRRGHGGADETDADVPVVRRRGAEAGRLSAAARRHGRAHARNFDYSADVKKLTMPTMLVFGDSDMYRPEHIVEFYKLLGGGLRDAGWGRETMSKNRLAIIPDQTHYDIFFSPKLVATVLPFLDGVSGSKTWERQTVKKANQP